MTAFLRTMFVIARRDFLSIVATPTFLLFLLAPLFMLAMGLVGGAGAAGLAESNRDTGRIVVMTAPDNIAPLRDADVAGVPPPGVLPHRRLSCAPRRPHLTTPRFAPFLPKRAATRSR